MPPPLPLGTSARILAQHHTGLIALEKPAGLASHPNGPSDKKQALLNAPYNLDDEYYQLADGTRLFLLNRIDSPTSGLVLATAEHTLAAHIKKLFRAHDGSVSKTYYAIVKGARLPFPQGTWRDRLSKRHDSNSKLRATQGGNGGLPAISHYQWLGGTRTPLSISLLKLSPQTGRTHQLRIQCAMHEHPIAGDKTYGDFTFNRTLGKQTHPPSTRLFLHAHTLKLRFIWNSHHEEFSATSPIPDTFKQFDLPCP
ncbi:MAG: RluA family pseudouridine synthase [Puniceicoccales bacterium]|jgi:23S rRNA-/tRNA-specific pseudouridylate synthase|nr:RluA family pseudouridine synthase [Puniceicoccales bacterium]